MSQFTKRVRKRMGWRMWFRVWKITLLLRLGLMKPTPPRYDEAYFEGMRTFEED